MSFVTNSGHILGHFVTGLEKRSYSQTSIENIERRIEIIRNSYINQKEIEGLTKFGLPVVGEIDRIYTRTMLRQHQFGEGIIWLKDK